MDQQGRPLRESDGSILFNAPISDMDATANAFKGINSSPITIPGDAFRLVAKEEYNDGCRVRIQIKDSAILSELRDKAMTDMPFIAKPTYDDYVRTDKETRTFVQQLL